MIISIEDVLQYEVRSSAWWVGNISNRTVQGWLGKYFAWKTRRKYARYVANQPRLKNPPSFYSNCTS